MRIRHLAVALALLLVTCKPAPPPGKGAARGPQVRAAVVTLRTTVEPGRRDSRHSIVVSKGLARSFDEQDVWHLFDLNESRVITVDNVERTRRTDSLAALLAARRRATAAAPAPYIPRARVAGSEERRSIQGVEAREMVIELGGYRRQLWVAEHPLIPPSLFAMIHAVSPATTPLAGMTRAVDEAFAALRGFPLVDHAELDAGDVKYVVHREVISIVERDVPAAYFELPKGYRDVTPKPPAAKRRR